jgi:lipoate-protein ligase A
MTWRLILDGPRRGAWNMDRDVWMASELARGRGGPVLRLYQWHPHAISLGWHQSASDVDERRAALLGVDVVRRPTGGRAILHADELTYCVVCPAGGRSLPAMYGAVNAALLHALSIMGIRASLQDSMPDLREHYRTVASAVCFSSTARNEVKVGGRKLIGSAQRRFVGAEGGEIVLQHGSILLGSGHEAIVDLLSGLTDEQREGMRRHLHDQTTTLAAVLGRPVGADEAASAVRRGFEEIWNIRFEVVEAATTEAVP